MSASKPIANLEDLENRILQLDQPGVNEPTERDGVLSLYESTLSNCGAYICRCPGDKFQPLQKILLKHIFSDSNVRSLFASDLYMFVYRLILPDFRVPMCQILMEICKIAPPESLSKAVALIKRMKHPDISFENPKFTDLLEF